MTVEEAKTILKEAGLQLVQSGLTTGTWGNISLRVNEDLMVVTPSGMDYLKITEKDIPVVDLASEQWTGPKPSSEYKLHAAIYRFREDAGAVIHTHSTNSSVVAAARREVPAVLDDLVQIIGPTVRVADYALPSTRAMVKKTLKSLKGRNAALLANHGAVCLGRDMEEAFVACQVLEKACKAFIEGEFLGGVKSINRFEAVLMHQVYLKKYSKIRMKK